MHNFKNLEDYASNLPSSKNYVPTTHLNKETTWLVFEHAYFLLYALTCFAS
jgi:hypothetical protein